MHLIENLILQTTEWVVGDWLQLLLPCLLDPENVQPAACWPYCTADALCKQLHAMKRLICNNRLLCANIGFK